MSEQSQLLLLLGVLSHSIQENRVDALIIDCSVQSSTECHNTTLNQCRENEPCFISCQSKDSCSASTIHCPKIGDCSVECGPESCRGTTFQGPQNGDFTAYCNSNHSCVDAVFNASSATTLRMRGCSQHETCLDLSIYCPPNTDGLKNCYIQGNDNLKGISIYALNSWNDVDIQYSGQSTNPSGSHHVSTMHCGPDHHVSCNISSSWNGCAHSDDYCHFNEYNELQLPSELGGNSSVDMPVNRTLHGAVLVANDDDEMDMMFVGAWVVGFAFLWFIGGLVLWKWKKAVRDKQEQQFEHKRQQSVKEFQQQMRTLDPEFIQQILKASGSGQDIIDLMDDGDHNPNDDVLPPEFDLSDSDMVPEPMPIPARGPMPMRVPTATGEQDSNHLAVEITPPSDLNRTPDPPQPSPSPAPSDFVE